MTTPTLLPRSSWTTHGPAGSLVPLVPASVLGIAVHWPGTTGPIGDPGQKAIAGRLDGYRSFHTAPPPVGRGWSDIAYSAAVDQAGRAWSLRGVDWQSAANGSQEVNRQYVAVLVLLGPGEQPSPAMLDTLRWLRSRVVLARYSKATRVVGHRDIRPAGTACPGPLMQAHLDDVRRPWVEPGRPAVPPPAYRLDRTLRRGMVGGRVEALQRRVNVLLDGTEYRLAKLLGHAVDLRPLRVDGDFGPATEDGVQALQRAHALTRDGVVGRNTCERALGWVWAG